MPNEAKGMIGLNALAKKAAAVVDEVVAVALAALLNEKASLLLWSVPIVLLYKVYSYPSTNTNISSAAIPSIKKIET